MECCCLWALFTESVDKGKDSVGTQGSCPSAKALAGDDLYSHVG